MWLDFLLQVGVFTSASLLAQRWFGFRKWSFVYLLIIPGVLFWSGELMSLLWGLVMSLLIYRFWRIGKKKWWVISMSLMLVGMFMWHRTDEPRLAAEVGLINQLRGEHLILEENRWGRFLHTKLDLVYFVEKRVEQKIGPVVLFAAGNFKYLASAFPVGFLFWWDLVFLIKKIVGSLKEKISKWRWLGLGAWVFLGALEGGELAITYLVALFVLEEMNRMKEKNFRVILLLDGLAAFVIIYLALKLVVAV